MAGQFEQDVIERLTRLETKIDNGISTRLKLVEEYIKSHPQHCPLVDRKRELLYMAGVVGGTVALIELGRYVLGWVGG